MNAIPIDAGCSSVLRNLDAHESPDARLPTRLRTVEGKSIELLELDATGSTSWLFRGHHVELDVPLALKILKEDAEDSVAAERFLAEARISARIDNPFVIRFTDFGRLDDGRLYAAMSFLGGGSLDEALEIEVPEPATAVRWLRMAAQGLGAIHAAGYVHRDVKPENLMLSRPDGGRVVVVDLGIASPIGAVPATVAGTPVYMAPEQFEATAFDERTDVYALGCCAFELLTGRRYLDATELREVTLWHADPRPTPFPGTAAVHPALQKVVRRALSLERSRRYATMAEFERALCDAAARAGIDGRLGDVDAALAGPGWAERRASPMQTPSRPRPVVWAACALSLFAAPYLGARTARARSADEAPVAAGQATEVAPAPVARFTPGAPAAVGLLCR